MHLIDCHILTLPRFPAQWVEEMRSDLDAEPVNQHWLPGIDGDFAEARARGFQPGDFERMARVLGYASMNALRDDVVRVHRTGEE